MYYIIYKMAIRRANFRIDPANALGIEADETRSKLIALALSKPENYYKLRDTAIGAITKNLAVTIYDMYWDILTEGIVPRLADAPAAGSGFRNLGADKSQLLFPGVDPSPYNGLPFKPSLPEKEVNMICSKIADQIKQIGRNVIEEIMPMNHLEMAQKKQVDILKAKGI
jgi:hypothetical protein